MITKACPDCGDDIPANARRHKCGWKEHTKAAADPLHGRCENVEFGQRCANPGSLSHSTFGAGPWLCRQHFFPSDPLPHPRPTAVSDMMLEPNERTGDGMDWARLIRKREEAGEVLPILSIEMANDALHVKATALREPGSDDQ